MGLIIIVTLGLMLASFFFFSEWQLGKFRGQSYWLIVLVGALMLWAYQGFSLPFIQLALLQTTVINPLRILLLFFSFTILAIYLDEVGFIRYLASIALHRAGTSQARLFLIWFVVVACATTLTANDIVILTLTPFMIYFCRHARISPIPYLVSQFVSANTWSMLLIIGNPTNIYIASMFELDFLQYFLVMIFPTLITGITCFVVLKILFHSQLRSPIMKPEMIINPPHPSYRDGVVVLALAITLMIFAQVFQLGMDVLTVASALALIALITIRYPKSPYMLSTLKKLPYAMIPFFLSMAILVEGINALGWTTWFGEFLNQFPLVYSYGFGSFLTSNLINNIPMSLWFTSILRLQTPFELGAIYASIIGSNLGAIFTPIGALAGLMWMGILKQKQVAYGFLKFMVYGILISSILLGVALVSLDVILG